MESQLKCHLFRATSLTPVLDCSICLASFVALVKSWCCHLAGLLVCLWLISSPSTSTETLGDLPKATQLGEAMGAQVFVIPKDPSRSHSWTRAAGGVLTISLESLHLVTACIQSSGFFKRSPSPNLLPLPSQVFYLDVEMEMGPSLPLLPSPHPPAQPRGSGPSPPSTGASVSSWEVILTPRPTRCWGHSGDRLLPGDGRCLTFRVTCGLSFLPKGGPQKKSPCSL